MKMRMMEAVFLACGLVAASSFGQPALPTPPLGTPLNWWRFDNTNLTGVLWASPISASNVVLVDSWDGSAAQVDSNAWLAYRVVETNGHINLALTNGTAR